MSRIHRLVIIFLFCCFSNFVVGQGVNYSPYAALSVGELSTETVAAQDMMGGTGVSTSNPFYINQLNPALIVKNRSIGYNKYVGFSIGFKGGRNSLQQANLTQNNFGLGINNLSMAFPITPKWAIAIFYGPYSYADYRSKKTMAFTGSNYNNSVSNEVSGGLSKIGLANSVLIGKKLYLGIEAQHFFGTITNDSSSSLTGSNQYYRNSQRVNYKGVAAKAGFAFQQKLNKKWNLNVGGTYQMGSDLTGKSLRIFSILADAGSGPMYIQKPDTLYYGNITSSLPSRYKIGISLESPYHWVFAAEYGVTQWSGVIQYDKLAQNMYHNATEINVGLEWVPKANSTKYLNQGFYRIGYRYVDTPYLINNMKIKDNSVTLGFSLPMGFRNPSYIDLGVAIGKRGINTNGNILENYIKISANFSLLSTWFNKPKID